MSKDTIGIIRVLSAWAVGDLKDGEHDEIAALQVMSEGRIEEALSSYFSMPLNRFVIKKAITKPISQLTQDDRDIVAEFAKILIDLVKAQQGLAGLASEHTRYLEWLRIKMANEGPAPTSLWRTATFQQIIPKAPLVDS